MLAVFWNGAQAAAQSFVDADPATGLQWSRANNRRDIDWLDAQQYCAEMAAGWRLPKLEEISALYLAAQRAQESTACGKTTCHFPHEIRLSAPSLWSANPVTDDAVDGDELAWRVLLVNSKRTRGLRDVGYDSRAPAATLNSYLTKSGPTLRFFVIATQNVCPVESKMHGSAKPMQNFSPKSSVIQPMSIVVRSQHRIAG